jgi:hypothetical protein
MTVPDNRGYLVFSSYELQDHQAAGVVVYG